jgi:hypothetical protein
MRTIARPATVSPLGFGRRRPAIAVAQPEPKLSDDIRLFLWTFAAGFLSVSIFLA